MSAWLYGINMTTATRFETRYVTRANLATRYASCAAQFNAQVESTSTIDTSHFASSLAPTMRERKEEKGKTERPVASGNLGLCFCASISWCTYPGAPSIFPMCVSSAHNCAHNLRARHMDVWMPWSIAVTERYTASPSEERKEGHKGIQMHRRSNEGKIRVKMQRNTKSYTRERMKGAGNESVM